jgi:hypothetical protein
MLAPERTSIVHSGGGAHALSPTSVTTIQTTLLLVVVAVVRRRADQPLSSHQCSSSCICARVMSRRRCRRRRVVCKIVCLFLAGPPSSLSLSLPRVVLEPAATTDQPTKHRSLSLSLFRAGSERGERKPQGGRGSLHVLSMAKKVREVSCMGLQTACRATRLCYVQFSSVLFRSCSRPLFARGRFGYGTPAAGRECTGHV